MYYNYINNNDYTIFSNYMLLFENISNKCLALALKEKIRPTNHYKSI